VEFAIDGEYSRQFVGSAMRMSLVVAIAVLASVRAFAADFSGTWKLENVFRGTPSIIICTMVQTGNALTGSCKPEIEGIAPSELAGTVEGASARWGYDVVFNGNPARVDYEAEIGADGVMKGSLVRSGSPSPITGVRL
jgi:hypothetical protein